MCWCLGFCLCFRAVLRRIYNEVRLVDVLDSKDAAHLAMMKRPDLGVTFTKLHCWTLTHYSKCVFMDADTLVGVWGDMVGGGVRVWCMDVLESHHITLTRLDRKVLGPNMLQSNHNHITMCCITVLNNLRSILFVFNQVSCNVDFLLDDWYLNLDLTPNPQKILGKVSL